MSRFLLTVAALLLLAITAIHLNLYWSQTYNRIPTIGWLFLLTGISGVLLAIAEVIRPGLLVDTSAFLFAAGVLGGYLLTLWLPDGLFKFKEPDVSGWGAIAIVVEVGVMLVAGCSALRSLSASRFVKPQPTGV
jgi:hypothetical protein